MKKRKDRRYQLENRKKWGIFWEIIGAPGGSFLILFLMGLGNHSLILGLDKTILHVILLLSFISFAICIIGKRIQKKATSGIKEYIRWDYK